MILDLAQLENGFEATFRIPPDSPVLDGFDGEVDEPLDLDVLVRAANGHTFVVDAVLAGAVARPCRRCLAPVESEFRERFTIVFQMSGREEDTGDDDVILLEAGATRIDLTQAVRDHLFLETDLYPICRPECPGICPECGRNLNEGSCECRPGPGASRWAALEALRDRVGQGI